MAIEPSGPSGLPGRRVSGIRRPAFSTSAAVSSAALRATSGSTLIDVGSGDDRGMP